MIVRKKRVPVHPKPCLKKGMTERKACSSKSAKIERERRRVERILYQNLSRYYSPPKGKEWVRSQLLVKGKCGHDHSSYKQRSTYPNSQRSMMSSVWKKMGISRISISKISWTLRIARPLRILKTLRVSMISEALRISRRFLPFLSHPTSHHPKLRCRQRPFRKTKDTWILHFIYQVASSHRYRTVLLLVPMLELLGPP